MKLTEKDKKKMIELIESGDGHFLAVTQKEGMIIGIYNVQTPDLLYISERSKMMANKMLIEEIE